MRNNSWLYLILVWFDLFLRVDPETTSCQDEPKFIVIYSMLLAIFSLFWFKCKSNKPSVTMKQHGTMVIVYQHCLYCGENAFVWRSQPLLLGKYQAGNILLSFAILMAGASVSKIFLVYNTWSSACTTSVPTSSIKTNSSFLLFCHTGNHTDQPFWIKWRTWKMLYLVVMAVMIQCGTQQNLGSILCFVVLWWKLSTLSCFR